MRRISIAVALLLATGCARDSGEVVSPTQVQIVAAQVDQDAGTTNWIAIASDHQIHKLTYGPDVQTNSVIWFHFNSETQKRIAKKLHDNPDITRFRLLRAGTLVAEFEFRAADQIGQFGFPFRGSAGEVHRIVKELRR